jgi:hypothetical protein
MTAPDPVEARIDAFLARYSVEIHAELRAARQHLRGLFPRGHELVFDNYNALVFGFSPSAHSSESFISVAGYPKWVTLFFLHGVDLDDPQGLLEGTGKQVRGIRLDSAQQLAEPAVSALVEQAMAPHREALLAAGPLETTIKLEAPTQRSRRPAEKREKGKKLEIRQAK